MLTGLEFVIVGLAAVVGGRLAGGIRPVMLRRIVVTAGVVISVIYFTH